MRGTQRPERNPREFNGVIELEKVVRLSANLLASTNVGCAGAKEREGGAEKKVGRRLEGGRWRG